MGKKDKAMKCPKCKLENPDTNKFCRKCGGKLTLTCPQCNSAYLPDDQFCGTCGHKLEEIAVKEKIHLSAESERKHVTVLFSDMSGYTAMTEKLDPEEVKEIMGNIFGEISKIVAKYEGFIEKYVGDAVMALFGVPKSHEDDPVRAIKAAREIHDIVSLISPQFEKRIGKPLVMHTGICTGLVVTGEVNLEKGTHGALGDTINTAARLSGLAKPGEIIVNPETYYQTEGYFTFDPLDAATLKGKTEPVKPYKVLSPKEAPSKTHRLSGLRAELIGRRVEMGQLKEAVDNLKQGKASIFSIVGDAGTGKSRLIEEFKSNLDLNAFQWREGHAYAYTQNTPYYPLIDLLNRAWEIKEGDPPTEVKHKVESGAEAIIGERNDLIPFIGGLYSLSYPETEQVSPESFKARLHEAINLILANLSKTTPTVVCIEDLHWADPSSIELLRNILIDLKYSALFICIYRPTFSLFTSHQISGIKSYNEVRLHDLSSSESQDMVESLLESKNIPSDLRKFIRNKIEGNPFYLEEAINSLIETEILTKDNGSWKLALPITEKDIPITVQGVISARLDRLERETKHILQEASVIGRAFLYEILNRITELKDKIDRSLSNLERLDLIRTRSIQPDLEYIFKHALTQEVVYNGLLKKERRQIHDKIGLVMEELFQDRLHEFYETLAYHFKAGQSLHKAVEYLMKAGEKSTNRYALDEANQYYQEAFTLLSNKPDRSMAEQELLIDILNHWSLVEFYRGHFGSLLDFLFQFKHVADSIQDKAKIAMYYFWIGQTQFQLEMYIDADRNLRKSLAIAEEVNDQKTIGYACCFLAWVLLHVGKLDEAEFYGNHAVEISGSYLSDHILFSNARGAVAMNNLLKGMGATDNFETGELLLEYGVKCTDPRALFMAHLCTGNGHQINGDFLSAIESYKRAVEVSVDPFLKQWGKALLGWCYLETFQLKEAEKVLSESKTFDDEFQSKTVGSPARGMLGILNVMKGNLSLGIEMMGEMMQIWLKNERKWAYVFGDYNFGMVYSKLAEGGQDTTLPMIAKNIGFLIKNVPFAAKKAEDYFQSAIEQWTEMGAKGWVGRASLDLGHLHKIKGRKEQARKYITDAIQLFEECEADVFLKQAKEVLAALG